MENQHRKITGYRELSQDEIDLMNEIKAHGHDLADLITKVQENIAEANKTFGIGDAEPYRWAAIARTDFQTGLMALTRAVARPEFF